ncbi:phage tail family protein [Kitasatospora purpeofusca]|uniref:phage distal tail protein n=1 Tax=Kitasatospora purpeofusca TaxID=67352 RepID=UPI0022553D6B|nr:phage tail domain-containing protein [Kitasatospora purpeofusca]MCX4687297.1 phage tail family protein [Kitasatospora purpeofusca]
MVVTVKSVAETSVVATLAEPFALATRYGVRVIDETGRPVAHDSAATWASGPKDVTLGNDTSATGADYPLIPGTTYYVQAKAGDATSWGPWSDAVGFLTKGNPPPPPQAPAIKDAAEVKVPYRGESWTATYSDVLLGGESGLVLDEVTGLLDSPDVRASDRALLQRDGIVSGRDYLGGRIIHLSMTVLDQNVREALAAFQPGTDLRPFRFAFPGIAGGAGYMMVKVRKRAMPVNGAHIAGAVPLAVELFAPDPLMYSDTENVKSVLRVPGRGSAKLFNPRLKMSFSFAALGATAAEAPTPVLSIGDSKSWPVYTIKGPVTNPSIVNRKTGERITVLIKVPTNEALTIDTLTRSVLLNGASRYGQMSQESSWFPLRPGANDIVFEDLEENKLAAVDVRWRSAWL